MVFKADHTCYRYDQGQPKINGKWDVEVDSTTKSRKYKIVWAGGATEGEWRLSPSDDKLRYAKTGKIGYERYTE